jgi:hypothetical protein
MLIPLRRLVDEPRVVSPELFAILPAEADVAPAFALAAEHARSGGTIAATFPDVAEAERRFQEWGWRESAARVFTGTVPSGGTRLEASVFRFADDASAALALPYFLDARAEALALSEVPPPAGIDNEARTIAGPTAVGYEATAYVRRGRDLFRLTAIGGTEPMADLATVLAP